MLTHLDESIDDELLAQRFLAITISRASSSVFALSLSLRHRGELLEICVVVNRCCRGLVCRVGADGVLATSIYAIAYRLQPALLDN